VSFPSLPDQNGARHTGAELVSGRPSGRAVEILRRSESRDAPSESSAGRVGDGTHLVLLLVRDGTSRPAVAALVSDRPTRAGAAPGAGPTRSPAPAPAPAASSRGSRQSR